MKAPARPSCGCHAAPDPFAAFAWEALRAVLGREVLPFQKSFRLKRGFVCST